MNNEYGELLMFLKVDGNTPEVVTSSEGLHSTTIVKDKIGIIKQAAEYLQEEILQYASSMWTHRNGHHDWNN